MGVHKVSEWRKLPLSLSELCIDTTLRCGQSFRWRRINDEWHCVLDGRLVSLKQDPTHLHHKVTWPKPAVSPSTHQASAPSLSQSPTAESSSNPDDDNNDNHDKDDTASLLHRYFALSHSLSSLYTHWAAIDTNFARRAPSFTGIRILNQDAWEALIAFICSSNNNIARISQMVHKLCLHYGPYVAHVGDEAFHDFPRPEALAAGQEVEAHLRSLGFGYRARYIAETARVVAGKERERDGGWLRGLRNPACLAPYGSEFTTEKPGEPPTYRAAHDALLQLAGVGPKVADCVCLMGLGWGEAVPVDTHVWQIAQRDYNFGKGSKSKAFTRAMYDAVGDHFRGIWGPQAGWAQSVLFTANLKSFAEQASSGSPVKKVKVEVEVKVEEPVVEEVAETETITAGPSVSPDSQGTPKAKVERRIETAVVEAISRTTRKRKISVQREEVSVRRTSKRLQTRVAS